MGRAVAARECTEGTCSLHLGKQLDRCLSEPRP
jgi:hypothetical protein